MCHVVVISLFINVFKSEKSLPYFELELIPNLYSRIIEHSVYKVAPVNKYGGNILSNITIPSVMDALLVVVLTVSLTYTSL